MLCAKPVACQTEKNATGWGSIHALYYWRGAFEKPNLCFPGIPLSQAFATVVLLTKNSEAAGPLGIIRELLQNNVAGAPVVHAQTEWDFDPEISEKRRPLFYELNGYRASKFIERIGVGIDGKQDERRADQNVRDQGKLEGEHLLSDPQMPIITKPYNTPIY